MTMFEALLEGELPLPGKQARAAGAWKMRARLTLGLIAAVLFSAYLSRRIHPSLSLVLHGPDPVLNSRVVVASSFSPHADVYMAVAGTLRNILPDEAISVYRNWFDHGFEQVASDLELHAGPYYNSDDLLEGMAESDAKVVILGTCEIDMDNWSEGLWKLWQSRPSDNKFRLVCMVHHAEDIGWAERHAAPWAGAGALSIMTIADHVRQRWLARLQEWDELRPSSNFRSVQVDVHVPVLPVELPRRAGDVLVNAVVQGNFQPDRRDYYSLFSDLENELAEDPTAWGYLPRANPEAPYERDPSPHAHPFTLNVAGSSDNLDVPLALVNVVRFWRGLPYHEFYRMIHSMDVVLPAFAPQGSYLTAQASSTVAMALTCDTPLLATTAIRNAYTYINDDRITITRPSSISEIAALKMLRTGRGTLGQGHGQEAEVRQMLRLGWKRSSEGFAEWKGVVWRENERVLRALLSG